MSDVTAPTQSVTPETDEPTNAPPEVANGDDRSVGARVAARTPTANGADMSSDESAGTAGTANGSALSPAPEGVEIEVECPGCGLGLVGDTPRPTAAWFCPRCDYPLFWVSPAPAPAPTPLQKRARRRLPGTGGASVLGAEKCWHCGEMNEPGETTCLRCAATLPKPIPPVAELPVRTIIRRERTVVRTVTWPYTTAAMLAGASVALAAAGWAYGVL